MNIRVNKHRDDVFREDAILVCGNTTKHLTHSMKMQYSPLLRC